MEESCWGNFYEGLNNYTLNCQNCQCPPIINHPNAKQKHAGSTLLLIDIDDDYDKDIVLGDISFSNLNLLKVNNDNNNYELEKTYSCEDDLQKLSMLVHRGTLNEAEKMVAREMVMDRTPGISFAISSAICKNKQELLILASIIQREASSLKDSRLVASVFINRLENNMKLQSDVTLAYGFNTNGQKITKNMLKSDNPFNTYYHKGLPPTPISYPGENSLNSLKFIKKTNFFYFVSNGKGEHRFSETYKLHKENIKLWKNNIAKD